MAETDSSAPVMEKTVATPNLTDPKNSKKKPLMIIGIVIAALLVIGGGVAAFAYFSAINSPEGIATDIFTNLVREKNVQVSGKIKQDDRSVSIKAVTNSDLNANLSATVNLDENQKIGVDGIYSNGDLYVKVEDVSEQSGSLSSLNKILEQSSVDTVSSGMASLISLDDMKGTWWKISASEISETLGKYLGNSFASVFDGLYTCAKDAIKDFSQNSNDQIELYKKNNFITLKEKSKNVYDASIDRKKLADFMNGLKDTSSYKKLSNCFNNMGAFSNSIKSTVDEEADTSEQIANIPTSLVISINDNRQLTKIAFTAGTEESKIDVDLSFDYKGYTNISAPSDSKSFTNILKKTMDNFFGGQGSYSSFYPSISPIENCSSSNMMNCVKDLDIEDI